MTGGTPLMDGGIFDNSGIESLLLIRERSDVDAIIVCDADATSGPLYREPSIRGGGMFRVWMLLALLAIIGAAAIFAAIQSKQILPAIFSGVVALTIVAIFIVSFMATRFRPMLRRRIALLTVRDLVRAIVLRASSVMALSSRVFMRRMRGLIYQRAFRTSTAVIDNLLNALIEHGPTDEMRARAKRAASMATTLWFDDEETLREIIDIGEMTTCFNLVNSLEKSGVINDAVSDAWMEFTRRTQ